MNEANKNNPTHKIAHSSASLKPAPTYPQKLQEIHQFKNLQRTRKTK
jgi:hypothetical protein